MKISCPKCSASGTIPDHQVPESGRFINCPRCHEGFTISKPRSSKDVYLVDTCPSCGFSTFGDETFSTCPKCGVVIKTFVDRQREEQRLKQNQELLSKKMNNTEVSPVSAETGAAPIADFIENLHPVNLIGWGIAVISFISLCFGLWGIISYDCTKIQSELIDTREEHLSAISVFLKYGLPHWIELLYGISAMGIAVLFLKRMKISLKPMSILLWVTIILVPLLYIANFILWVQAPIPHKMSGYVSEILNTLFMSLLVGVPLYFLESYLHERKITSVVKL